jgi:hypothetical protein
LKLHNATSSGKVWEIYDHMTDDIFEEMFQEVSGDMGVVLDTYLEAVIEKEFG